MSILVVDDEQVTLTTMRLLLRRRGFKNVEVCNNGREAIEKIKGKDFDLVLLDLLMPEIDGLQVLESTKPFKPRTEFIILTAVDDVTTAVKAIQLGAYDYLVKPVENERLLLSIERAYERLGFMAGRYHDFTAGDKDATADVFSDIITQCGRMKDLLSYAKIMARSVNPILITGESGTGKELLAGGIHRAGPSAKGPFVAVNLSSVPESLFESQIFGHIKGAFTGAEKDHKGFFEQANGGTLFLDEIGEIPAHLQVKLLRVLEEKAVTRIGDTRTVSLDVRIVSATNQDLSKACQEGRFRLDLMYRLNSAHIHLPPLREREGDIPLLTGFFLKKACALHAKEISGFSREALEILKEQGYPGNIRELAQIVEKAVLLCRSPLIQPEDLGMESSPLILSEPRLSSLKEANERHIAHVLAHTKGSRKAAAEILGLSVRQLRRRLAEMKANPRWRSIL
jgi:DNA-binding NtrC family response regulator